MKFPPVPTGPITIGLNGFIMDTVFNGFIKQYLPAYEVITTSGYRTPDENEKAGGAKYSAHQYNFARDFALKDREGNLLSPERLKSVYDEFVKPNWNGYSSYNPPKTGNTGWIHVNIDRSITLKTRVAEYAITGVSLFLGIKKIYKHLKKGGKT